MNNEVVIFENQNVKLEVNMKDEAVWLSQKPVVELFEKQLIDNNTLAVLTLLIAELNPKEKEFINDLVINFLNE